MIVGNVAEYIDRCLTSFAPIADEIVVVRAIGNQPPDETLDIARDKFGARTFEYQNAAGHEDWPHVDSFAAARQMSFDMALGEYCFWCDSDDVLKSGAEIVRALAEKAEHPVYIFPYEIFGRGVTVPRERMIRRTAKGAWRFPVHECFAFDQTTDGGTDERVIVEHLPKPSKTGSNERNLRILESVPPSDMTPGLWFHLHQELRAVGRIDESIEAAKKAITHPDVGRPEKYELLLNLATMTKDRATAHSYLAAAFSVNPQRREALGLMACCAIDAGRPADALALARQMIATERPADWSWNDRGAAYGWLGIDIFQQCLRAAGNQTEAERIRRAALAEAGGAKISLLHATRGRPLEASGARKMWMDLAEHPEQIEHIFAIDEDDDESFALRRFHHVLIPAGGGCVAAWNAAAAISSGDILVQLSDDWIPTAKWDTQIIERIGDVKKPSVLAIGDGHRTDDLMCMAICTRNYYALDWFLFHPDFLSMYSDNWFSALAYARGCVIQARDIVFTHDHPVFNPKKEMDATYAESNAPSRYAQGEAVMNRLQSGMDWSALPGWTRFWPIYRALAADFLKDGDTFVEVGIAKGRSLALMKQECDRHGRHVTLFGVDIDITAAAENLKRLDMDVALIKSDSAAAASQFENGSLSLVFIDAAHDYDSVNRDVAAWLPKVKSGGIIAGDDADSPDVARAVKELLPDVQILGSTWVCNIAQAIRPRPLLSILTPAIWSRAYAAEKLAREINGQCGQIASAVYYEQVEHITVFDNRARSVGLKRQACLDIARGDYIAFVDDDDSIRDDYVRSILDAIESTRADVITFDQLAVVNGESAMINFDLANADNPFTGSPSDHQPSTINHQLPTIKRGAWHVNVWKRELVKDCIFPDSSYGEDLVWSLQARQRVKTHHHIAAILHEYHHSTATTAAPAPV